MKTFYIFAKNQGGHVQLNHAQEILSAPPFWEQFIDHPIQELLHWLEKQYGKVDIKGVPN